ncbi:hypothetical protein CYY_000491 [Polysphondylium violaceum]|uniref:FAD-binding PCMH-type domain-containing protein n=1 Tax=Polysphondylium violaceum TaxID=133409 RepID=A0A8J4Q1P8_9MYCE|nr:hypothetical protein CYY_000491 [Polysphondylium violaceum]
MDKDLELSLKPLINGEIFKKGSEEYNLFLTKRFDLDTPNQPWFVVQPTNEHDIAETVKWCNLNKITFTAVCGGHDPKSAIENGIVFDFSLMKKVVVDEVNKTAIIEPGCLAGDVENETSKYGLVFPLGHISCVGATGLILGGGLGHLSRSLGLSCDRVIEYRVIASDGSIIVVNSKENTDLLWGLRGAGFYFGIVSSFKVELQPLKNIVVATYAYPIDKIAEPLLELGRLHNVYSDLQSYSINLSMTGLTVFAIYHSETITEEAKQHCEHLLSIGSPIPFQPMALVPYATFQKTFDSFITNGKYYEVGPFLKSTINQELVDVLVSAIKTHPTQSPVIILTEMGGQVQNDSYRTSSCFPARDSPYHLFFSSKILDDSKRDEIIKWTDKYLNSLKHQALCEYANTSYETHIHKIFNEKQSSDKLKQLKNKYDPNHLFNPSIKF